MKPVTVTAVIRADPDSVFASIVDIELIPQMSPDTVSVEFLTEQRRGAGTTFRETRQMGKNKTQDFDLELTECDPEARTARFVNETHGTVWDTGMSVVPEGSGCRVRFSMAAYTDSKLQSFIFSLMSGVFRRAMNKQVQGLKVYCEA